MESKTISLIVKCPTCEHEAKADEWKDSSVGCCDCGSHSAYSCPGCGESFDHIWEESVYDEVEIKQKIINKMKQEDFEKAQVLSKKIKQLESAFECFQVQVGESNFFSSDPKIVIEHDDCDNMRVLTHIPMDLSSELIDIIKDHMTKELEGLKNEFEKL